MKIIDFSKAAYSELTENCENTDIHLFTQFFIHRDETRYNEIKECLRKNVANPHIKQIHLLNERIYTPLELGISSPKIIQTNIVKRLKYQDVFQYIRNQSILGYHILVNSDIFFDTTIAGLLHTDLHLNKKMFALLRYEFNGDITKSPIFGPRFDSQDTWIFHSNFPILESWDKMFKFEFGKPGCDNKLLYLMKVLNYGIYNDPLFIKTYHYHRSQSRDYGAKDVIQNPWAVSVPANVNPRMIALSLGIDLSQVAKHTRSFQDLQFEDNTKIYDYVLAKISAGQNFIIPRISGIENNTAVFARIGRQQITMPSGIIEYFQKIVPVMKNNAGIKMSSLDSVMKYSDMYLKAFENAEMFCGWEPHGNYIHHIAQSHEYMMSQYTSKQVVWSFALDIFHYIFATPWTVALRGKRILIVSPFETSILAKIPHLDKIYGVDLFPECTILTIKPPQTQSDESSREFDVELLDFTRKLDEIKDTYDIALVSAGGYGNPICNHIYESGKSAVYVGGVLQMYFGILGNRWLKERPDIVKLFLNEYWTRPKMEERPRGCEKVENSCYW